MNQIIDVLLTVNGEEDVLIFKLDEEHPDDYVIDLNSDTNQSQLKKVFSKLLELLLVNDIELKYSVVEGYSKGLYKDVCEEYVHDLNSEIASVKTQIASKIN
jgi:hypothetical protein